jgi:hypothetical protein
VTATAQDVKVKIYSLYSIYIYNCIYILQKSIKNYQAYSSSDDLPLWQDEISSFRAVSERILSERSLQSAFPFFHCHFAGATRCQTPTPIYIYDKRSTNALISGLLVDVPWCASHASHASVCSFMFFCSQSMIRQWSTTV